MSLTLPSQLLLQQDLEPNCLLINPPQDDLVNHVDPSWTVLNFSFASSQRYEKRGCAQADFKQPAAQTFEHIIVYLPKAKPRLKYILDYASNALSEDGEIWFVGENKGGIKSLPKQLKERFKSVNKITSGKHSAIVSAQHLLASPEFVFDDYYNQQVNELDFNISALPGVFSQEKLDKGTALLLKYLPKKLKGRILDFGCGAGIIGSYISRNFEYDEIEMIDDDVFAVLSAQKNIEENKIPYTEAYLSNGLGEVEERYNWIVSNPPFHQGIKTEYSVTERFLAEAKEHLKLSGKLLIVANEFLSYEVILREHFKSVNEVVRENGFKVIQCEGIMRK